MSVIAVSGGLRAVQAVRPRRIRADTQGACSNPQGLCPDHAS